MNIKYITNPEIINKFKANNIQTNKDKNEMICLYNSHSLNRKKEKYSNFKNVKISNLEFNSEKNENINDNFKTKLSQSRNYLFRLSDRNNSDISHNSTKNNTERIFNFKTISNTSTKPKLFLRKFELELTKLINKKHNNKLINLKTFGNKFNNKLKANNFNNIKSFDFNSNEIQSKRESFQSKNNQKILKKNFSGKNFDAILRKIIYFNQKNDFISKKNIINLIQNEENSLNSLKSNRKLNKILKSKKISLSQKNQINIKHLILPNQIKKTKSEMNLFLKTDYLYNKKLRWNNINKKINLKTNYNEEYNLFDNEKNIDNYIESKEYSSIINYFKNIFENKNNNENNKEDKKELNDLKIINCFTDRTNIQLNNNFNEETNEVTKKKDNKNEMIIKKRNSDINNNRFSFTKFNNSSKNRKSIIEGYLLNYNINSEKIFSSILKDRNNDQLNLMNQNKESSKEFISEFEDILIEKKKVRNSYHNYLFEPFENKYNSNSKKNSLELDLALNSTKKIEKNSKKKSIDINENKQQKLKEKELSEMNIIYEENEQEKNNNNNEIKNNHFSSNGKNIKYKKTEKNKDIAKYINNSEIENPHENFDNKKLNDNINNKNSYINKNNSERYFYFNKNNLNNNKILSGANKYNYSRNNISPLKKDNTKNSFIESQKIINEKNYSNKVSEEEEKEQLDIKEKNNLKSDSVHERNKIKKPSIILNKDISINDLSILDNKKIDVKEKFNLIKEYKDKAIFLIFSIVSKSFKENQQLRMNIENLIKFMMIDKYKKYVNILKLLIDKERSLTIINKSDKVKDSEIFKYIHRTFTDQYSPYYIKPNKENQTINQINDQSIVLHLSKLLNKNDEKLSPQKKNLTITKTEEKSPLKKSERKKKENEMLKPKTKLKLKRKLIEKRMTVKEFIKDKLDVDEKQKMDFLRQKLSLTNELKYQIEITRTEEGKRRFKMLLNQIEALKNDDNLNYINFINEKYGNYKNEIQKLIHAREKEQRINYFMNDLIEERDSIKLIKKIKGRNVSFEYKI